MSAVVPLASIPVGVVVERTKGASPVGRFSLASGERPCRSAGYAALDEIERRCRTVAFYAGAASVDLYRTETAHYRDNLQMDPPLLWVILRPVDADPPYELAAVTADPAEGEGMTEAGANIVESLPMPEPLQEAIAAFIAEHHVDRTFVKRKRDRADPEFLGTARAVIAGRWRMNDPDNFLSRWSRRKREAKADPEETRATRARLRRMTEPGCRVKPPPSEPSRAAATGFRCR